MYYIGGSEPVLVDSGVAASPVEIIEPALRAAECSLAEVRWILTTHGHWDHIGGAPALRKTAGDGARIVMHRDDATMLRDRGRHMQEYWGVRADLLRDEELRVEAEAVLLANVSGELGVDREVADRDRIRLGGGISLTVIHTPGHSPGSVTYLLDDRAFVGDAVQVAGSRTSRFPLFVDPAAYRRSLSTLLDDVRPRRLYMGHSFIDARGSPLRPWLDGEDGRSALRMSLRSEERIRSAAGIAGTGSAGGAAALAAAAEALGYAPGDPRSWPSTLFATLRGYRTGG